MAYLASKHMRFNDLFTPTRSPQEWLCQSLTAIALVCASWAALAVEPSAVAPAQGPLSELPYSPSLDVSSMDRSANPCEDFYRYSCGGWQQANPIPGDQSDWSVYSKLHDENLRYLWALLLDAAKPGTQRSAAEQKTGDYFAACMNEDAINTAGVQPLQAPDAGG